MGPSSRGTLNKNAIFLSVSKVDQHYTFTFGPSLYWSVLGSYLARAMREAKEKCRRCWWGTKRHRRLNCQTLPRSFCISSLSPHLCFVRSHSLFCSSDNTMGEECGGRRLVSPAHTLDGWHTWRCASCWPRVQLLPVLSQCSLTFWSLEELGWAPSVVWGAGDARF